jgi:hypothetical protein
VVVKRTPELELALEQASEAHRLADYYRDCVRPLLGMPMAGWPRCCGRGCEPCAEQLCDVARDVYMRLGVGGEDGLPHE